MEEEYGTLDNSGRIFTNPLFELENGVTLIDAQACYNTYGTLNDARDNCVVVCHGFSANSCVDQWWGTLLGEGKALDPSHHFVVCANVLGSCYGSTGPTSINPTTGSAYGKDFPQVSLRDSVKLHIQLVREHLGVKSVRCVVGGSMGGMQALEWMLLSRGADERENARLISTDSILPPHPTDTNRTYSMLPPTQTPTTPATPASPLFVQSAVVIGCGARHSAWQIAFSELQRQAIYNDPKWQGGAFHPGDGPSAGLALARQIGMVSYRSAESYCDKFGRQVDDQSGMWQVQRYLQYQGDKFLKRMDALTYVRLTQAMDTHDVSRGREGLVLLEVPPGHLCSTTITVLDAATAETDSETEIAVAAVAAAAAAARGTDTDRAVGSFSPVARVLQRIVAKVTVVGMDSDVLYPLYEQVELANGIPSAALHTIVTTNGHDGFLLEHEQLNAIVAKHLQEL